MHVLLVNDDGPLDDKSCPYMKYVVDEINTKTDWKLSIVVPNQQRSWIGKAHFAGKTLTRTFIYTKNSTEEPNELINKFEGPFSEPQELPGYQEWSLIDSTPAACVDVGLNHLFEDVDLVLSGPNFGKNSSNLYILASGTVGSAMEGVMHDKKSIALSYSYSSLAHTFDELKTASKIAIKLVKKLYDNWTPGVDLYTVNVPLNPNLDKAKCYFAPILQNRWGHSIYLKTEDGLYKWNPDFKKIYKDGLVDFKHTDNRVLLNNNISVTPLKAKFQELEPLFGEIKLDDNDGDDEQNFALLDIPEDSYIHEPLKNAFELNNIEVTNDRAILEKLSNSKVFHFAEYEDIDIDLIEKHPENYLIPTNIYRKGLIRKHFLSHIIHQYVVKNPNSILTDSFPLTYQFELDYPEFLDDALDECWGLREDVEAGEKEYWILKPSMSDKGQGIRLFRTIDELQDIFNQWEEDAENEESGEEEGDGNGVITSQLRHFIVQEYQKNPLLLPEYNNKKFHFRVYVVTNGDLQVYVYKNILTLFAAQPFELKHSDNAVPMEGHLTNTCLQGETAIVEKFWDLKGISELEKQLIYSKICLIVNQVFKAATTVDKINFQPLGNATEFFGVDFIIDEKHDLKLLEINAYPDFKQTGDDLKDLIDGLFQSVVDEVIIPKFKGEPRVPKNSLLTEVFST